MFPDRVKVGHRGGDDDFFCGRVDLAGLEHPEAEAAQAGVAGSAIWDGSVEGRGGEGLPT